MLGQVSNFTSVGRYAISVFVAIHPGCTSSYCLYLDFEGHRLCPDEWKTSGYNFGFSFHRLNVP